MEDIILDECLLHRIELISEVYSSAHLHPKYSRICGESDCSIMVEILWLNNENSESGAKTSLRFPKNMCRNEPFEIINRFFKVRIVKGEGDLSVNKMLNIEIFSLKGRPKKKVAINPTIDQLVVVKHGDRKLDEIVKYSEKNDDLTKRSSSPFSFKKRKSIPKISSLPVDYRLPSFIPRNCLLVGDSLGKLKVLSVGNVGEILLMTDDGPTWGFIYPPKL